MAASIFESDSHHIYPFIDPRDRLAGTAAGKSVLITGAGGLIGRGSATSFALAGAAHLVLVGRRFNILEETREAVLTVASGTKVVIIADTDIGKESDVQALFSKVKADFGRSPNILINNAAVGEMARGGYISAKEKKGIPLITIVT